MKMGMKQKKKMAMKQKKKMKKKREKKQRKKKPTKEIKEKESKEPKKEEVEETDAKDGKLQCDECQRWVPVDYGKKDEQYGGWYCSLCWEKFNKKQSIEYRSEDPELYLSAKMKHYEKKLNKDW